MDVATILGVLAGLFIMALAVMIGDAPFAIFFDLPSVLCVFGGALCAVLVGYPLRVMKQLPLTLLKTLRSRPPQTAHLTEQIVKLAETARRDGLLALEQQVRQVSHPVLRLGMQLAIDGNKPEVIREVMTAEIAATSSRHAVCKGMMDQLGRYAPAFGMIGTLLGLVMMLNNMTDPSSIGGGMAVALLTTLYGAVLSNLFCQPMSEKLGFYHREEIQGLELVMKGVLAIQAGENPRLIEQKLRSTSLPERRILQRAA